MAREDDVATRMTSDATLVAILTGGVFKAGTVGRLGITRDTAPGAFNGVALKPCALVKQRGLIPDFEIQDFDERHASATQVIEVWLYEDSGFSNIDAAMARLWTLFFGYKFSDSWPVEVTNEINRQRDDGALKGASLARMDLLVRSVRGQ